jgi:hypothetical protein
VKGEAASMEARWHGQPRRRQTVAKSCQATHGTREGGEHPGVARKSTSTEIATDPPASAIIAHAHARSRTRSKELRGRADALSRAASFEHHRVPWFGRSWPEHDDDHGGDMVATESP